MKKKFLPIIAIIITLILTISIIIQFNIFKTNPFRREMPLENPLISAMDKDNNIYVIDQSMKRIVKMDTAGNVLFTLSGGQRDTGTFYYALELATDDNNYLYVLSDVLDGNGQYVEREDILRYSPDGTYDSTIYSVVYEGDARPLRKGRLSAISPGSDYLYCHNRDTDSFSLLKISLSDYSAAEVYTVDFPGAENLIVDFATSHEPVYSVFTTKKGEMYKASAQDTPVLFYPSASLSSEDVMSIPWEVELDSEGTIYFTDLGTKQIRSIDTSGNMSTVLSDEVMEDNGFEDMNLLVYRFSANQQGNISSVFNGLVLCLDSSSKVIQFTDTAAYSVSTVVIRVLIWAQLPLLAALLIILLRLLYIKALRGKISTVFKQSVFLVAAIGLCSLLLINMIFSNYNSRYENEVFNRIAQTIQLASRNMDGDLINRIAKAGDFMNTDYQELRTSLHSAFNDNSDSWNEGFYGAIYKVEDDQLYAVQYYDDSVCPYYPLYSEPDYIYIQSFKNESILTLKESDAEGDWMYGVGPIYDSDGEVAGLLEVGTDLYGFTQENARLKNNLILEVATILVIIILMMIEITILSGIIAEKNKQKELYPNGFPGISSVDASVIRPIGFVVYTSAFMSQAFIPLLMRQLYTPVLGLPESLVIGLPISVEALFLAISAVFGGYLIDRKGWKNVFITGLGILILGQLFSALAWNAPLFILARMVSGTGFGLSLISMQSFVILPSSEEGRNIGISALNSGAYAGINTGVVIGSMLAERIGFSNVFFVSSFLALLSLLLSAKFTTNYIASEKDTGKSGSSIKTLLRFLTNKKVLSFFLFIFIPVAILVMFMDYYFPLFAEEQGLTPANIGRAFLLNGLSVVYLGPVLSKYLSKYLGNRITLLVSALIAISAVVQFAIQGTLLSALIAVVMLGISESFGITAKITWFTSLPAVKELGEGKALGYYGLAENLGQILGPIVYGSVIVLGISKGIGSLGLAVLVLLVLFSVTTIQFRRRTDSTKSLDA